MNNLVFRSMEVGDIDNIMKHEVKLYSHPWTKGIFHDCIKVGYLCKVVELNQQFIGYGVMSIAAGESHILNISVLENHQNQGFGGQLLEHFLTSAKQQNAEMTLLEVRESNKKAIHLYEAKGFNEIGVRKDYYPASKGREDAIILAIQL